MRATILYVQRVTGGGSATGLLELLRRLDRSRVQPIVAVYEDHPLNERYRELDVRVIVLDVDERANPEDHRALSRLNPVRERLTRLSLPESQRNACAAAVRVIQLHEVDLVHHNNNLRANRASVLAAWLAGVPQVCHMRFFHPVSAFDRWLGRRVDHFIHISRAIAASYRQVDGHGRRGSVIYEPVDVKAYAAVGSGEAFRADLGLAESDRVIANIGRLVEWKGQEHFLRAMQIVLHQEPRARGVLVGSASDSPDGRAYQQRLLALTHELSISDRIVFAGFRRDVPAAVAAAEVVVHSSCTAEPLGLVIVEALAGARPVVATGGGGVLDLVDDGVTGRLVPLRDPPAMAQAILDLLRDPVHARRLGLRGQAHVAANFDADRQTAEIQRLYARILSRVPAAPVRAAAR